MSMWGWGREDNVPRGVGEPLYARAMFVEGRDDGSALAYVCADLGMIAAGLRVAVLDCLADEHSALGLDAASVVLTATHTHSGPSGFSHALFYDLAGPGFSQRVFDDLVRGIVRSILDAHRRLVPARLGLGVGEVPREPPIAFNRSLDAYRQNAEVRGEVSAADAVDRAMTLLVAKDEDGVALGAISFFGLHGTTVHGDQDLLHSDHKGLAATAFERWARESAGAAEDFVAIFAQGAGGDVTPNSRPHRSRGFAIGPSDDDHESARFVAEAQVETARRIFVGDLRPLGGPMVCGLRHVDMEERPVAPSFVAGRRGVTTTEARLGLAMVEGTSEGPGPLWKLRAVDRLVHRVSRRLSHLLAPRHAVDPKIPFLSVGPGRRKRLLGRVDPLARRLGFIRHPIFRHVRRIDDRGVSVDRPPWIPTVLPVQLVRLGSFVLVALPNEPTTMAGARLRRSLEKELPGAHVQVQGYSNAYSGYVTTPEEYALQCYEGAYTLFGAHTLAAFEEVLVRLARAMSSPSFGPLDEPGPPLPTCTREELAARAPL